MNRKYFLANFIIEMLAVVVGITIAFWLDNWNEERIQRHEGRELLIDLREALANQKSDMETNVQVHLDGVRACGTLQAAILGDTVIESGYRSLLAKAFAEPVAIQNNTAYESLKARGLNLIENDSLQQAILNLYEIELQVVFAGENDASFSDFFSIFQNLVGTLHTYHTFDTNGDISALDVSTISAGDKSFLLTHFSVLKTLHNMVGFVIQSRIDKVQEVIDQLEAELADG